MKHTYELIKSGISLDGWYKFYLKRDDGKEVAVSEKRYNQLVREGRIK